MTNHWTDLKNSDCIMAIGCNPAEKHPISFKWIQAAPDKGAKLIAGDPRYTRTASKADAYARIRPGTDIAFFGGLINYALTNNLIHTEYVREYTNASFIVNEGFGFKKGMFDHWDEREKGYNVTSWTLAVDGSGRALRDLAMNHPRCVLQLLKMHYSRYSLDVVTKITGTDKSYYLRVAETFCGTSRPGRTGTILYAMGIAQSTHGVQNVRATAMLQMLLFTAEIILGIIIPFITFMRKKIMIASVLQLRGASLVVFFAPAAGYFPIFKHYPEMVDYTMPDRFGRTANKVMMFQNTPWCGSGEGLSRDCIETASRLGVYLGRPKWDRKEVKYEPIRRQRRLGENCSASLDEEGCRPRAGSRFPVGGCGAEGFLEGMKSGGADHVPADKQKGEDWYV